MKIWIFEDNAIQLQLAKEKIDEVCGINCSVMASRELKWPPDFLTKALTESQDFPDLVILDLFLGENHTNPVGINIYDQLRLTEISVLGSYKVTFIVWSISYIADEYAEKYLKEKAEKDQQLILMEVKSAAMLKKILEDWLSQE